MRDVAIINFGRMNPMTIGHEKLIKKLAELAKQYDADPILYLSKSYDGVDAKRGPRTKFNPEAIKNPIKYEDKLGLVERVTIKYGVLVSDNPSIASFYDVLHDVYERGYRRCVVMVGDDRLDAIDQMISYNGSPKLKDSQFYDFEDIEAVSAGARDESSDDDSARASGTLLRKLALAGDKREFFKLAPNPIQGDEYGLVRKEMGLLEKILYGVKNKRLSEAALRKNVHQTHVEDLIALGPEGCDELIEKFEGMMSLLEGHGDGRVGATQKIDGAPAVIVARSFDGVSDVPCVGIKSFFSGKVYTDEDEIRAALGDRPDFAEKMLCALRVAEVIPEGQAWQGDFLFTRGDLKSMRDGDVDYLYFKPNTIAYCVPRESDAGKAIAASEFGIAFHTRYQGSAAAPKQSFDVKIEELPEIPGAWLIDPRIPNLTGKASFDARETAVMTEEINKLKDWLEYLKEGESYSRLCQNDEFVKMIFQTYQNSKVDEGKLMSPDFVIQGLKDWVDKKSQPKYAKASALKTDAGRTKATMKVDAEVYELKAMLDEVNTAQAIRDVVQAINMATEIKAEFMRKMNSASRWIGKAELRNGSWIDVGEEGFAVSDVDGNIVKFVDRSVFSRVNRDPNVVKGFERPNQRGNGLSEAILSNKKMNELLDDLHTFIPDDDFKDELVQYYNPKTQTFTVPSSVLERIRQVKNSRKYDDVVKFEYETGEPFTFRDSNAFEDAEDINFQGVPEEVKSVIESGELFIGPNSGKAELLNKLFAPNFFFRRHSASSNAYNTYKGPTGDVMTSEDFKELGELLKEKLGKSSVKLIAATSENNTIDLTKSDSIFEIFISSSLTTLRFTGKNISGQKAVSMSESTLIQEAIVALYLEQTIKGQEANRNFLNALEKLDNLENMNESKIGAFRAIWEQPLLKMSGEDVVIGIKRCFKEAPQLKKYTPLHSNLLKYTSQIPGANELIDELFNKPTYGKRKDSINPSDIYFVKNAAATLARFKKSIEEQVQEIVAKENQGITLTKKALKNLMDTKYNKIGQKLYVSTMNDLLASGELIGISLKKVLDVAHVTTTSTMAFSVSSTSIDKRMNLDNVSAFVYSNEKSFKNWTISNISISKASSNGGDTSFIKCSGENVGWHLLHKDDPNKIVSITVRRFTKGSIPGIEAQIPGEAAQLGKGAENLNDFFKTFKWNHIKSNQFKEIEDWLSSLGVVVEENPETKVSKASSDSYMFLINLMYTLATSKASAEVKSSRNLLYNLSKLLAGSAKYKLVKFTPTGLEADADTEIFADYLKIS
jgi:hypothetical protein